jgi:hypothetical protein
MQGAVSNGPAIGIRVENAVGCSGRWIEGIVLVAQTFGNLYVDIILNQDYRASSCQSKESTPNIAGHTPFFVTVDFRDQPVPFAWQKLGLSFIWTQVQPECRQLKFVS